MEKDFGFILCDRVEKDVYFQQRLLPPEMCNEFAHFGYSLLDLVGRSVTFELRRTKDGKPRAKSFRLLGEPKIGRVEKYNGKNRHGFIVSSFLKGNVYFQMKDVPVQLRSQPITGLVVRFETLLMKGDNPKPRAVNLEFHPAQFRDRKG